MSLAGTGILVAPLLMTASATELVHVTATRELSRDSAPFANSSTMVVTESLPTPVRALAELLRQQPAVDYGGQGGMLQMISLRGMSRQRLGAYYMDIPLFTERRAGTAASFVDSSLTEAVEVVRGPASVLHGVGAVGGVVRVHPLQFQGTRMELGWGSSGDENQQLLGYGNDDLSLGFSHRGANDSYSADGSQLNTGFNQYNLSFALHSQAGPVELSMQNLFSYAQDIGKSNRLYLQERVTDYPLERHWLTQLSAHSPRDWRASAYLHAQDLQTRVERVNIRTNQVDNQSIDLGAKFVLLRGSEVTPVRLGLDYLARRNVEASEQQNTLATHATQSWDLLDAERDDIAIYADMQHSIGQWQLAAGARLGWTDQRAENFDDRSENYASGFLGMEWFHNDRLSFSAQLSTGQRPATLSERYFSGTTGRGVVRGNPRLDTESVVTIDLGARWESQTTRVSVQGFFSSLDDLIERLPVTDDVLRYRNNREGEIYGTELSVEQMLGDNWTVTLSGHYLESEDMRGNALEDTAPARLNFGVGYTGQAYRADILYEHRFSESDVALTEQPVDQAKLLSARLTFDLSENLSAQIWGRNLLNDNYIVSTDDLSTTGEARAAGFSLRWH